MDSESVGEEVLAKTNVENVEEEEEVPIQLFQIADTLENFNVREWMAACDLCSHRAELSRHC